MRYLVLLIPFALIIAFIWSVSSLAKQSKKDWETLEYLKKRANEVTGKEELEEFHKEFLDKASKIHNKFINPKLMEIDGYVRGMYKQYIK